MTAPSLLDELEGVVRLSNEADRLPYGEGRAYAYRDATMRALNFVLDYHANIADMAKRLEEADKLLRDIAGCQWFNREAPATVELIDAHLQAAAATQEGEG